ncbi:MAG: PAS domain-containing sensor histidine kinase [Pseudomonadota bacterium]
MEEQALGYKAQRRFLDGQLAIAMACVAAFPLAIAFFGTAAGDLGARCLAVTLALALFGIVSITQLKSLTAPSVVWGVALAFAATLVGAAFDMVWIAAACAVWILVSEGSLWAGRRGSVTGAGVAVLGIMGALAFVPMSPELSSSPLSGGQSITDLGPVQTAKILFPAVVFVLVAALHAMWSAGRSASALEASRSNYRRERDRFHLMADNASDLVTRHNRAGRTLFASSASNSLLGMPPSALLDTGLMEKVHLQDRVLFLQAVSRAANDGETGTIKLRLRSRTADCPDWAHVEMRCRPFVAEDGSREGAVVSTRDISAEIIATQKARSAEAEAREATAAQRRFLMNMSHELRTPLNAIIGFSDMLAMEGHAVSDAAKRKEYVEIIQQSGQHLLQVVNGLLDLSRIEAGKYELTYDAFCVRDVVESSVRMLSMQAQEQGVELRVDLSDDLPDLTADRGAIQQVLINLLSNAIKFSRPKTRVRIRGTVRSRELTLVVEDQGIGIASDCLDKLGEPFWQAQSGSSRSHQGSGLGLSVVCGLVELHGGSVSFKSQPGRGTTVSITLPLKAKERRPVPENAERSLVHLTKPGTGLPVQSPKNKTSKPSNAVTVEGNRHARASR